MSGYLGWIPIPYMHFHCFPHLGSFPLIFCSFRRDPATNPYVRNILISKQEDANAVNVIGEAHWQYILMH